MAHHGRVCLWTALVAGSAGLAAPALRAEYIICYDTTTFTARVRCEPSCETGEWLWARHEEAWRGCGPQGPDCGSAWGAWGHYTTVGPDPCPEGCWRTETADEDYRILGDGAKEERDLWHCQGTPAAEP